MRNQYLTIIAFLSISFFCCAQDPINQLLFEENYPAVINQLESDSSSLTANHKYSLSISYKKAGYYNKAIALLLTDSLRLNKDQEILLCNCYYETGDYRNALPLSKRIYTKNQNNIANLIKYVEMNNFYKEYDLSIELLSQYTKTDSLNFNINLLLADTYDKAEMPVEAAEILKQVLSEYPNNQKIGIKLAKMYYNNNDLVECHDICKKFLTDDPHHRQFLLLAAMANYKAGVNKNALIYFKRLEAQGDSSFITKKHLGIIHYKVESYDKATTYLYSAHKKKSDDIEVSFFLGASLGKTENPNEGMRYLHWAKHLLDPSPNLVERIYVHMAQIQTTIQDYQQAVKYYKMAYQINNKSIENLYYQASIYDHKLKDNELAHNMYFQFLAALPCDLNPKKGKDLYIIELKKVVEQRMAVIKEEEFFKVDTAQVIDQSTSAKELK